MSLRVALLSMDKVREFGWVTKEEHRCVISDEIENTFLSLDLDGETCKSRPSSYALFLSKGPERAYLSDHVRCQLTLTHHQRLRNERSLVLCYQLC